jgi:hypothetical protein
MLKGIGFSYFGREQIEGYYELIFASGHLRVLIFGRKL